MCWQECLYNEYQKSKMPQNVKFDIYNEKFITCLFESLELDYLILISLLCDDETFKDKFVPKLMLSEFYFASCNRMVKEIPKLFENEETLQRIVTIHLCNKEMKNLIDEEQQEQYKQILKVGNKFVRKVIK